MSDMTFGRITPRHLLVAVPVAGYLIITTVLALKLGEPDARALTSRIGLTVAALGAGATCLIRSRRLPEPRMKMPESESGVSS